MKRLITCMLSKNVVQCQALLHNVLQNKWQIKAKKGGNCAFNCLYTHAYLAPACASMSCYSCANSHLSCSKYWANFITFGLCLSTQHLCNGVWVAAREIVHCCLAARWRSEKPHVAESCWRLSCGRVATHPHSSSENQIFVLEDRAEAISTRNMLSLPGWKTSRMRCTIILLGAWHTLPSNFVLNSPFLWAKSVTLNKSEIAFEDFPINWRMNSEAEVVFNKTSLQLLFINAHVMAAVVPLLSFTTL